MSKLVRIDPNPIEWTKEDVILNSNSGVKYGPKTPSANAVTVDQGWYAVAVSVCDTGDYLSIVPYIVDGGHYGNTARVGDFKVTVKQNGGSYALFKPQRLSSPWAHASREVAPADNPSVQIRIYKNHKVAVLNYELVDGQDVWYVDTRFRAPFGALWSKDLQGDAKVAEGFKRQPDLVRVYTDEDVEKAASQIRLKDVSSFKGLIPNWAGDLSSGHLLRMTATSYAHTGDATTKIFENFFNVMAPEKAGLRAQWRKKSGINLDAPDKSYYSRWMVIDALYWAACNGSDSAQKAIATRQSALESLVAPFASDINALSDDDNLWGRTDAGDIMFAHKYGSYYTVATFFTPNGKVVQGEMRGGKWEAGIANINRANINSAITANKVQTKIASGQTAKSIFAGTVVEELVNANAPVIVPSYWSGDAPQTSSWDQIVTDKLIAPVAAMALYAENKPIIPMLRKAGLMRWYAYTVGRLTGNTKFADLFTPTGKSSWYSSVWKYDQKAKTLEDALDLPMSLLRHIDVIYDGSYSCNNFSTKSITGAFSREEYQQLSDDELQKFVEKVTQIYGSSGGWKREATYEELRSTVPDFEDRRYVVMADDPAAVKVFLEARKNLTPEQWSPSWDLKGGAPAVYSYKDKVIKQLSKEEVVHEIAEWYSVYKNGRWNAADVLLESHEFHGIVAPIRSLEDFRKELDALRIGQDATLVQELTHGNVYRIRKSSDPNTPYFILITSSDGTFKTLGYLGCDASKSAQMRCMLQRRQMIYRDPIDVNALVASQIAALRKIEKGC